MANLLEFFQDWIRDNRLLVMEIIFEGIGRKTIKGRMIKFNQYENSTLIYIDDTKTVEHFMINQIDEITPVE
ncbi:hypothetical protein [Oceanobacillus sp. CF4.6]|uniref:hypothetical protein n=1 Tax=Oceanobacillus sp. CF4.6 TaxID=3373080 RepID=UPI003EE6C5F0